MLSTRKLVAIVSSAGLVVLIFVPLVVSTDERPTNKFKGNSQLLSYEIELHGFLLWGSVGILMPISILIKRMTNREEHAGIKLRIIFYVHAITQVLAVVVAAAGGIMFIKYFDNTFNNDHQKLGLVFYGLIWLQILVSFFRPHRGSKGRIIWFLFHYLVGIATSLIGVINIYTGIQSYHQRTSKDVRIWKTIFMVEMCFILFVYLLQEKWHHIQKQRMVLDNIIIL